jgi:hypothetical protein
MLSFDFSPIDTLGFSGGDCPFSVHRKISKAETRRAKVRDVLFAEMQKERLHVGHAVGTWKPVVPGIGLVGRFCSFLLPVGGVCFNARFWHKEVFLGKEMGCFFLANCHF